MNDMGTYVLKALEVIDSSRLWALSFRCCEQLRVVDDMNDSGS